MKNNFYGVNILKYVVREREHFLFRNIQDIIQDSSENYKASISFNATFLKLIN